MNNLFKNPMTAEMLVDKILSNPNISGEIELMLLDTWREFAFYSDEEWDDRAKSAVANSIIMYLPTLGKMIKNEKISQLICRKLTHIISGITGMEVKSIIQINDEEFEVEFFNDILRPMLIEPRKMIIS